MIERGILFKGRLVRSILRGLKTQTRRLINPQPAGGVQREQVVVGRASPTGLHDGHGQALRCPYGLPGDRLWVRETWSKDALSVYPCPPIWYRADFVDDDPASGEHGRGCKYERTGKREGECFACALDGGRFRWRPGIHMFRRDSRLLLDVGEIRAERLQDISEDDARAEGIDGPHLGRWTDATGALTPAADQPPRPWAHSFAVAWNSINAERAPWASNPWVWAVTFRRAA